MARKIKERWPERLLDAMISWHTRRGIRKDCTCNFCIEKRIGTAYIGRTQFPVQKYREHFGSGVPVHNEFHEDMIRDLIHQERERKRRIVRRALKSAKEEIL